VARRRHLSLKSLAPLVVLVACGPRIDPLLGPREAYREALLTPPSELPPHAVVRASDEQLGALLGELAVGEPLTAPGPFGMKLVLLPEVSHATMTSEGREPLSVHADLRGTTDLVFPLLSADDVPWEAEVRGELTSWTREQGAGLDVGLRWHDPSAVAVSLRLPDVPDQAAAVAEGAVKGAVVGVLDEGIGFTVPRTPWGAVRDVRLEGSEGGLTAELVLSGLGGAPPPLPDVPAEGLVAAMSEGTALGVAQAIAIEGQQPDDKYVIEPVALTLSPDVATVDVRVHKRARRPKYRTYRLAAPLQYNGESLSWPVAELQLVDHERWPGGVKTSIGERRALALLEESLDDVPDVLTTAVGKRSLTVRLTDVEVVDGAVVLRGKLTVDGDASAAE